MLIDYLHDHPNILKDKTVIELGSGTGILGIICKKNSNCRVILTDYDDLSLEHMEIDCEKNNIDCEIVKLDRFSPVITEINIINNLYNNKSTLQLLAGDVLYKKNYWNLFLQLN